MASSSLVDVDRIKRVYSDTVLSCGKFPTQQALDELHAGNMHTMLYLLQQDVEGCTDAIMWYVEHYDVSWRLIATPLDNKHSVLSHAFLQCTCLLDDIEAGLLLGRLFDWYGHPWKQPHQRDDESTQQHLAYIQKHCVDVWFRGNDRTRNILYQETTNIVDDDVK